MIKMFQLKIIYTKIQAISTTKDYCPGLMKNDPTRNRNDKHNV